MAKLGMMIWTRISLIVAGFSNSAWKTRTGRERIVAGLFPYQFRKNLEVGMVPYRDPTTNPIWQDRTR
jgi:hypothetical protein